MAKRADNFSSLMWLMLVAFVAAGIAIAVFLPPAVPSCVLTPL